MQVCTGLAGADPEISERGHRDPQFLKAGRGWGLARKKFLIQKMVFFCVFHAKCFQNWRRKGGGGGGLALFFNSLLAQGSRQIVKVIDYLINYIHFEITGHSCILIGS